MPFTMVRQDITKMKVDAIVNAANTELRMGGGVCGAIFKAAGVEQLQTACDKLAPIKTGEAVITPGFKLPATYVIHAAGPVYREWSVERSAQLLRSAYMNSLKRAVENACQRIAFPLISSGIYGYPKDEALQVAMTAIHDFLDDHDLEITLVIFDKSAFSLSQELRGHVENYLDEHYLNVEHRTRRQLLDVERIAFTRAEAEADRRHGHTLEEKQRVAFDAPAPLDHLIGHLDEPFSDALLKIIDAKGMSDVAVYKRANIDRKLFSKIRSGKGYMPSKRTAIALAIALELSLEETDDLLTRAGYALSRSVLFDVIITFFITKGRFDIFEINSVLFAYDQPLLGAS